MNRHQTLAFAVSGLITLLTVNSANAQQYASDERARAALGHYARARTMLVEALAEFEQGRRLARPDMLLDAEEWRLSVVSRTEELNRVLDPQPRVTRSGVRFKAVGRLIRREHDRTPAVQDGAQDSNTYGEEQRQRELSITGRANDDTELELPAQPVKRIAPVSDEELNQILGTKEDSVSPPGKATTTPEPISDSDFSKAIEEAVEAQLEKGPVAQPESNSEETHDGGTDGLR